MISTLLCIKELFVDDRYNDYVLVGVHTFNNVYPCFISWSIKVFYFLSNYYSFIMSSEVCYRWRWVVLNTATRCVGAALCSIQLTHWVGSLQYGSTSSAISNIIIPIHRFWIKKEKIVRSGLEAGLYCHKLLNRLFSIL